MKRSSLSWSKTTILGSHWWNKLWINGKLIPLLHSNKSWRHIFSIYLQQISQRVFCSLFEKNQLISCTAMNLSKLSLLIINSSVLILCCLYIILENKYMNKIMQLVHTMTLIHHLYDDLLIVLWKNGLYIHFNILYFSLQNGQNAWKKRKAVIS